MVDYDYDDNHYNYKSDEGKIKKDFMKYADPKTKQIKVEGMEKMGKVLNIDIYTDIFITYFFYKCGWCYRTRVYQRSQKLLCEFVR